MIEYKQCKASCFNYDPRGKGCSYNDTDFYAKENVSPGQKCLHPEFSQGQLIEIRLIDLCALLEGMSSQNP
jgi:hypothetical protein